MELEDKAPDTDPRAVLAFQTVIAKLALPDEKGIDRLGAMVLIENGVFSEDADSESQEGEQPIDPESIRRIDEMPPGPLVVFESKDGKRHVSRIRDLLLDQRMPLRQLALDQLDETSEHDAAITSQTTAVLSEHRCALSTKREWRRPAIEVAIAIDSDWLLNLLGLRQCGQLGLDGFWSDYFEAVLRPAAQSLTQCAPRGLLPKQGDEQLRDTLNQLAELADDLSASCDRYVATVGHMPHGQDLALSTTIASTNAEDQSEDVLKSVLSWGLHTPSPIARYHACEAALASSARMSAPQADELSVLFWEMIVPPESIEQPSAPHSSWALVTLLARYFLHYQEVRLPTDHSEALSAMAWWLATRITMVVTECGLCPTSFKEQFQHGYESLERSVWELVQPPMQPSLLRWLTLHGPSAWATAALSSVDDEATMKRLMDGPGPGTKAQRVTAITQIAFGTANLNLGDSPYRFDAHARDSMCWAIAAGASEPEQIQFIPIAKGIDWTEPQSVHTALDTLSELAEPKQQWVCMAIHQRIATGAMDTDDLWIRISDEEWRTNQLQRVDIGALSILIRSITDDALRRRPEWWPQVPHLIADLANSRSSDSSECAPLFGMLARACCVLNAPSALARLMSGECGHRFRDIAAATRTNILHTLPDASGWACGRLRGLLVDLL